MNFVSKFLGIVRFGNDQIARIMRYGDYQLGNVVILRKKACFIRNLEGVDLLSGSCDINLYTISLDDMLRSSLICLLSKASKTKSWLWHRRLSHLNFGTVNKLVKDGLARGIARLKFQKDHLCSACASGKSKKSSHQPKAEDTNQEKLYLLHIDLCGPMHVASINGKRYILVIVNDYSRFTWVRFLKTKDEAPAAIIKCIKNIQVRLNATIRNVQADNGTEFFNQTLHEFYENVGISHQTSVARTPQQNDVVERRNRTLVEAARTMLIFSKAPLFLWAEAINTACYTQNRIEDMVPNIWSPVKVAYDKYTLWGISHWREQRKSFYAYARGRQSRGDLYSTKRILVVTHVKVMRKHGYGYLEEIVVRRADNVLYKFKEGDDVADFVIALIMFTRSLVIQKKVEDLQLEVESYQKQIKVTKPDTTRPDLRKRHPYTPYKDPQGFIYVDDFKRNRLMRSDELYKFSDGTLTMLLSSFEDITKNIDMEYLPKRRWSTLEKKRAHFMIKYINNLLKERKMMRSLEKFIGGRLYGTDLRLLQKTI
ncbi:retrovirus-related pol polyprotein from transposon TNT 1-94 [Tanacetum coccineum]|uniref:Retrovirus-related pol polyprotein from transposon TNT 1-94 n=1 Tax=Tanacetum coccineum TaxID=301880 RepID=A0ABQ4WAP1_9ASTR